MDGTGWLELLSLFTAARSLILPEKIARQITRALDATTSETVLATEVLLALRLLHIWPNFYWRPAVKQFTSLRRLSCRPIAIVGMDLEEFNRLRSLLAKEEKVPDRLPT
ncbi:hypothetical protein EDB89DRAFT_1960134 [Lactarius sanguifluus]|nr:hypothetical protein EDB89DRAFT_1960134 [Lactarius sanguifluus]